MRKLDDDCFQTIGVWGMGGVGKTTLVKNLNNKLNTASSNHPVSKDLHMKRVQKQIAQRLNLELEIEASIERTAGRLYQRLEKVKFLLFLDNMWQSIDLDCVGIPQPEVHKGSKIIWTSRFSNFCGQMMTDVEVKVSTLGDDGAWKLFSQTAGEVAILVHITSIAKDLARECCGLPLALHTVGIAMRRKTRVKVWQHALKALRRLAPCIKGGKDKVYNPLNWSYDSLEGNNLISCFLYCALYPEDFLIEVRELVHCWLGEGLIDGNQDFKEIFHGGVFVAETLKASCLLEDGLRGRTVKMHDVVWDVAMWIASLPEEDNFRTIVRSRTALNEIRQGDLSEESLKRISFMYNQISRLPCSEMQQCSKASTLLLQSNFPIREVPDIFLEGFQGLKVSNMSETGIQLLPSLLQVGELRVFLLSSCPYLKELHPLGALRRLQVLDLHASLSTELPEQMENVINLRHVNLSRTHFLVRIPAGIVSKGPHLEVLDMTESSYQWRTKEEVKDKEEANFEELFFLDHLSSPYIQLRGIPSMEPKVPCNWIGRTRRFHILVRRHRPRISTTRHDKRKAMVNWYWDLRDQWMGWLLIRASSLVWENCRDLSLMIRCFSLGARFGHRLTVDSFVNLKSLTVTISEWRSSPEGENDHVPDLLPNLEELSIEDIASLQSVSDLVDHLGLKVSKLKKFLVSECPHMKYLFSIGSSSTRRMCNL